MDNSNNSGAVIGENVKRLPLKDLVKRIGSGLIATGIVIGPGAVTTSAMIGANYGSAVYSCNPQILWTGGIRRCRKSCICCLSVFYHGKHFRYRSRYESDIWN